MENLSICFVCHGNICRSTTAEFIMSDEIKKHALTPYSRIDSRATHNDEIGSPPYYASLEVLRNHGVEIFSHVATRIRKNDYDKYDLILCMDDENFNVLKNLFDKDNDNKVHYLREFNENLNEILKNFNELNLENLKLALSQNRMKISHDNLIVDDPYYTRNFEKTFDEIQISCRKILEIFKK